MTQINAGNMTLASIKSYSQVINPLSFQTQGAPEKKLLIERLL
jgi:hypothetical protein